MATIISAAVLIFSASTIFGELQDSINSIWGLRKKETAGFMAMVKTRLLSFGLIASLGFILMVSLIATTVLEGMGALSGGAQGWIKRALVTAEGVERQASIAANFEAREFGKALREIMEIADVTNQYVDENKPWVLAKDETKLAELHEVCTTALILFRQLTILLSPVLPGVAAKVKTFLNDTQVTWADTGLEAASAAMLGRTIGAYSHLMTRVDAKMIDELFDAPKPAAASGSGKEVARSPRADADTVEVRTGDPIVVGRSGIRVFAAETQARQNLLYEQGRSRPGPVVTWTRNSNHLVGRAVDVMIV